LAKPRFLVCPWCGERKSRAALDGGHRDTRGCVAKGHELRAWQRGLVRLGSLTGEDSWRIESWLPVLLRGRAPIEVLPTRAERKGNQYARHGAPRWKPSAQLWVPGWVNLLLATEPRDGGERLWTPAFVALLRWAARAPDHAAALATVYRARKRDPENIHEVRHALFALFVAANPGKSWPKHPKLEKRESEDLQE